MSDLKQKTPIEPGYHLRSLKLPRVQGLALNLLIRLLEGPLRFMLIPKLLKDAGMIEIRNRDFEIDPILHPSYPVSGPALPDERFLLDSIANDPPPQQDDNFRFHSVTDYYNAYRSGERSPSEVADRACEAIIGSNKLSPALRAIISFDADDVQKQAAESAKRWAAGKPIGFLDGVPIAVKEEFDMLPFPTTAGTSFLGSNIPSADATPVQRLRAAGAILIGKANMHEFGMGVTGLNVHTGTPRNPYNLKHHTGGSSSGCGSAVAAGIGPIALGADGGGSIRIPAAFNGVVGLKATFGRVSEHGAFRLCWSVAHVGPIAATAVDAAIGYATMAGPDVYDPNTLIQPSIELDDWQADIQGLKLGIYQPWLEHCDPEISSACSTMLDRFKDTGAVIRDIEISGLEEARVAHAITISAEMCRALEPYYRANRNKFGADIRLGLALARSFTARDFLQGQRIRAALIAEFERVFQNVDIVISPATGIPAPKINQDALTGGESDLSTLTEIMRFATPSNLTGHPAISFPIGYTESGLPIGMQAIGRAWDEKTLLKLAYAAESLVSRRKPDLFYDLLA